jgi:hypothetical protein
MSDTTKGLQLRSLIKKSGELELSLAEVPIPEPGPDQVCGQGRGDAESTRPI